MNRSRRYLRAAGVVTALAAAAILASSVRDRVRMPDLHAQKLAVGSVRLRYIRAGQGPTVLLLHGYGESLLSWRAVFDRLRHSADVIAIDLPGHGLSSKPGTGYQTDSLAAMVIHALDALGVQRAMVVGHSLGGAIGAAVAIRAPARVQALVLIDPAGVAPPGVLPDSASTAGWARAVRRGIAEYEVLRSRLVVPHDPRWLVEWDSASAGYLPAADSAYLAALEAILREFDFDYLSGERARRIMAPTVVIWGERDQMFPLEAGRRLAAALPDAKLVVVPRSWHRPHVERPEAVAEAILELLERVSVP